MGFSLENIIDDTATFEAPDDAFIGTISGMVQNFPWERFERFFEARPLVQASAVDQVFLLRILAIQELLCMDDETVLKWLKNQMFLFSFLSPGFKSKIPSEVLLNTFREKLQDANILEPFRLRCQNIILKKNQQTEAASAAADFTSTSFDESNKAPVSQSRALDNNVQLNTQAKPINIGKPFPEMHIEDKWVICPKCESSSLSKVDLGCGDSQALQARCEQCGHEFKV